MENNNLNLRKDPEDDRDFKLTAPKRVSLPRRIDWRDQMSPVKNQGRLGSCVGFAVTAVKEFHEQQEHVLEVAAGKTYQRDIEYYDLSESWVYWMSKKLDPWPNEEGTSIRYAMKVLQKVGVPTEEAWPYDVNYTDPKIWAHLIARWGLIKSYQRINNLQELKVALKDGPVAIGIGCFEEIFRPNRYGFVDMPKNTSNCIGGHAICITAYNDTSRQVIFKNSWSSAWGDKGYGRLSYEYINNYMWDAWACKDVSVTTEMLKGSRKLIEG
jgi:C1A family cysteine protease